MKEFKGSRSSKTPLYNLKLEGVLIPLNTTCTKPSKEVTPLLSLFKGCFKPCLKGEV
nr:MAG TPA: hypothetical protein [Caudoviricetes sp.]